MLLSQQLLVTVFMLAILKLFCLDIAITICFKCKTSNLFRGLFLNKVTKISIMIYVKFTSRLRYEITIRSLITTLEMPKQICIKTHTCCITPKCVTSWPGPSPRCCIQTTLILKKCRSGGVPLTIFVQFDQPEI